MQPVEAAKNKRASGVPMDPSHAFCSFAAKNAGRIHEAQRRYSVGVIVTGGQTGVDSAAIAFASERGIPMIGFAPRGYIKEDGLLPDSLRSTMLQPGGAFALCSESVQHEQELLPVDKRDKIYAERTELNAKYSSATLIINAGKLEGGTLFTLECVLRYHSPNKVLIIDPTRNPEEQIEQARTWIEREKPLFLNVAGPRQSYSAQCGVDVFNESLKILRAVLR
jgi:hypothetical protein